MSVAIFKLQREFDWYEWLCPVALARWIANGWTVREEKEAPHPLRCVDRNDHNCCPKVEGEP